MKGKPVMYQLVLNFDSPEIRRAVAAWLIDGGGEEYLNQVVETYGVDMTFDAAHVVPQYGGWESIMPAVINVASDERDSGADAMELLREQFGEHFDAIDDVDAWVKQHRKGME